MPCLALVHSVKPQPEGPFRCVLSQKQEDLRIGIEIELLLNDSASKLVHWINTSSSRDPGIR